MIKFDYLEDDLHNCKLCEWRCGVDRLAELDKEKNINLKKSEVGVCGCSIPLVASSQLHPALPASYDAFLTGCNFRCLFCQNWPISMFDHSKKVKTTDIEGYYKPEHWAELALVNLMSDQARLIGADRLFFTGGEPTCSLPWVEEVVRAARQLVPTVKVNFDTNGFLTIQSLRRVLEFTNSITYDLKAFNPELFSALTGANVKPILRNLKDIIKNAFEKIWEVRVMVIPGVHDEDIAPICKFLSDLNPKLKINFLAFLPNFVLEKYLGATEELLDHCVAVALEYNLENATWSGCPGLGGKLPDEFNKVAINPELPKNVALLSRFASLSGCSQVKRNCGTCSMKKDCKLKRYKANVLK